MTGKNENEHSVKAIEIFCTKMWTEERHNNP